MSPLLSCLRCSAAAPDDALFCPTCGVQFPRADVALRTCLLECYLELSSAAQLSDWLEGLGQNRGGSNAERRARVRANTKYLTMPAFEFPDQTLSYLTIHKDLAATLFICERVGLPTYGTRAELVRRILRHVHVREGWLPATFGEPTTETVFAVTKRYPLLTRGKERDFCAELEDELTEIWPGLVHRQYTTAVDGKSLRIDLHIGQPGAPHGIGIEFKVPHNNSEVQRTRGQIDQYLAGYPQGRLALVVVDDGSLSQAALMSLERDIRSRGVETVVKRRMA